VRHKRVTIAGVLLYSLTIFLSAFLLFEVQPVIAKMILPWFGGSSAVWSTCMLFFQVVLLLGYLYAHGLNKLAPRRQAMVHIGLLAVTLISLPIIPNESWKHAGLDHPSATILMLLGITVGLPYFVLSSTSPLIQAWYARTHVGGVPYRLFALSNFASMLALLTYPFLVEPNLPSRNQAWIWSGAFVCFAAVCAITAWKTSQAKDVAVHQESAEEPAAAPGFALRAIWLALSASASVLLLAVTTHLTQDVAAIPFLWILPLTVYLLTFIICFESPRLYYRPVFVPLFALSLAFMAYRLWPGHEKMEMRWVITLTALSLFNCCMVCHGELVRLKPHPRYLTGFYVTVSLGGAVGGLFVGMVAPNLFHAYYEFPIGLILCGLAATLVFALAIWRNEERRMIAAIGLLVLALAALAAAFRPAAIYPWWVTAGIMVACAATAAAIWLPTLPLKVSAIIGVAMVLGLYGYWLQSIMAQMVNGYDVVVRNFYGQLRVYRDGDLRMDEYASRRLVHGTINHGEQFLNERYRRLPVTYFCPLSGIGRGMQAQEGSPRRIGVLGLGCGTLAAYAHAGDTLRIYEINPQMLDIATHVFTYTTDTPAKVEYALGDGRLVLEAESDQHFDMLVMDAFSGDSVPVHLITREAFQTYFRHLKPNGILAVNISNTYLDLEPVMERAANAFGKTALVYHYTPDEEDQLCFSCSWTLIMDPATAEQHPALKTGAKPPTPGRNFHIWTDDFSNMFSILK
jgi:SAM-dependent methyltransferase